MVASTPGPGQDPRPHLWPAQGEGREGGWGQSPAAWKGQLPRVRALASTPGPLIAFCCETPGVHTVWQMGGLGSHAQISRQSHHWRPGLPVPSEGGKNPIRERKSGPPAVGMAGMGVLGMPSMARLWLCLPGLPALPLWAPGAAWPGYNLAHGPWCPGQRHRHPSRGTPGQTGWGQTKEGPAPVPSLLYQGLEPQLTSVSPPGVLPDADSRVWGHGTGVVAVPGLTLTVSCSIPARAPPSASSGDGPLFH